MWAFNFSTRCPDPQGRQCADVLADDLAAAVSARRPLGTLRRRGVRRGARLFSATLSARQSKRGERRGDLDADGRGDDGIIDGVNSYSAGLYYFYQRLRQRLGEERLVMADGHEVAGGQKCYGVLNGVEAESALDRVRKKAWPRFGRGR